MTIQNCRNFTKYDTATANMTFISHVTLMITTAKILKLSININNNSLYQAKLSCTMYIHKHDLERHSFVRTIYLFYFFLYTIFLTTKDFIQEIYFTMLYLLSRVFAITP